MIFTYAFMLDSNHGGKLVPYINNSNPLWMNVEEYIDKVFKTSDSTDELGIYDFILSKLNSEFNPEYDCTGQSLVMNGDDNNQRFQIGYRILQLKGLYRKPEELLFAELNGFEKDFADYLKSEIENLNTM